VHESFVTSGVRPIFLGGSLMSVLKNDGIYSVDWESGQEMKILEISAEAADIDNQYDISLERSLAVLSMPSQKRLRLMRIESVDPITMTELQSFVALAYSPKISPDGSLVAAYIPGGIMVVDMAEAAFRKLLRLRDYLISPTIINGWF
jgi:hypothetical protein